MKIEIENYDSIQHPCVLCLPEHPRGGCIMFIKKHLMKFVQGVDKNYNDVIIVYMSPNIVICGLYIPPINSKYFGDHFDILELYSVYEANNPKNVIVCGDLNARVGSLNILNGCSYKENPDTEINQHGRTLIEVCTSNYLVPLNMVTYGLTKFSGGGGGFTFTKGILSHKTTG